MTKDALISYKGGYKTATEQQRTYSLDKDFMMNLLKGRVTELENQLKQTEAVNQFSMSTLQKNSASSTEKRLY